MKKLIIQQIEKMELNDGEINSLSLYKKYFYNQHIKEPMKNLFARKKILKNGQEGKLYEFPDIIEIHTSEELIHQWIDYGTFDAEVTWFLYHTL